VITLRYVIVSIVKGKAGEFNNNLRKEVFSKYGAKSSKLPAHFTIKAPFEYEGDISDLENILDKITSYSVKVPYTIEGFDHFGDRVVYMKVNMSKEGKILHDDIIDSLETLPYISFDKKDGKNKIFHVTVASKRLDKTYSEVWEYVSSKLCSFQSEFDNIAIYKWENNTWVIHKEFKFKAIN
jgi:2'-5' RNA ligase